ncbi:MAG: ABC transporter permease [Solirubrobacterales bacterium]|nr:ABC transporter permease [Solirubrobacterales bacterium]
MSTGTLLEEVFDADLIGHPEVVAARTPSQLFWRRFRQDRVAIASLGFIVFLSLVAIFAPLFVALAGTAPPNAIDSSLLNDFGLPTGPSLAHPFGVDGLGRDVLSRTVYGARTSLEIAILATLIATGIGVVLGMLAGFFGGWIDTLISRSVDVMLAFPVFLLALGLASGCSLGNGCAGGLIQPGISTVVVVIAIVSWTYPARLIRGQVLSLKEKEFVDAARSIGASNSRILFREILPNLVVPIIVYASLMIPTNILLEAALSFLGAGVPAPTASWGAMISDATSIFNTAWWYMLFPGLAILFTALAFNLVGDGLTDAMNPRAAD